MAALQHLPGSQRAVLILRDVLEYSATEVATMLDTTPTSVHSSLQRARKSVVDRIPPVDQHTELEDLGADGRQELVEQFVSAWERADLAALVELLAEDARFTMPPLPAWFLGRQDVGRFFAERVFALTWHLQPTHANGQLSFACYQAARDDDVLTLGAINVLTLRDGRIAEIAGFLDPEVHRHFALPTTWSVRTAPCRGDRA